MSRLIYPFIDKATVANNLREAIKKSGLPARVIAKEADVQTSHLSRFLKTGRGIDPTKIERIAGVLKIDVRKIYSCAA